MPRYKMTAEDKQIILDLYKAHYTAREVAAKFPWSYSTVISMFRVFADLGIEKHSRATLLEASNDA